MPLPLADNDATIRVLSRKLSLPTADNDATMRVLSRKLLLPATNDATDKQDVQSSSPLQHPDTSEELSSSPKRTGFRSQKTKTRKRLVQVACIAGLILVLGSLISGVYNSMNQGNDLHIQQQAEQNKLHLDTLLRQAQTLGVPDSILQPVEQHEQDIATSHPPLSLFGHEPVTAYYQSKARQYQRLSVQVTLLVKAATEQFQAQAQQDMQNFQVAISGSNAPSSGNLQYFSQKFSQNQVLLSSAQTPAEYLAISYDARSAVQALNTIQVISTQLGVFDDTITRMSNAHLDAAALEVEYQSDMQAFNDATQQRDLQNLSALIDTQYQQTVVTSIQAFPYLSVAKLQQLETQIHQLQQYGLPTTQYQQRLSVDQVAIKKAKTVYADLAFFNQVDADIASMQSDLVQGEAHYLVKQFHQEVDSWAKAHVYHDTYDGHDYAADNGYMNAGIGATLDDDLKNAASDTDFHSVIAETNNALFNLHLFERDFTDSTAYNQVHATDTQMLDHYKLQGKQVLLVSLAEQAMRVYQSGKLVQSYYVTTGRQELPSLPGVWSVLDRRSPVIFKAAEPRNSPYWFPDTPISFAILYHFGGYFVHDAPWRANFGPGTQFPHADASGTTAYNFDGSHGCINLQESAASWVYSNTDWNTVIVIY
jgi:hypothetical protein